MDDCKWELVSLMRFPIYLWLKVISLRNEIICSFIDISSFRFWNISSIIRSLEDSDFMSTRILNLGLTSSKSIDDPHLRLFFNFKKNWKEKTFVRDRGQMLLFEIGNLRYVFHFYCWDALGQYWRNCSISFHPLSYLQRSTIEVYRIQSPKK